MGILKSVLATLSGARKSPADTGTEASSSPGPRIGDAWSLALDAGRLPEALSAVDGALESSPEATSPRLARARILRAWNRVPEALDEVARANVDDVRVLEDVEDLRMLAWHANVLGDRGRAIAAAARAAELAPQHGGIATELGSALLHAGRFDEAASALEGALRIDPSNVEAHLGLAQIHVERGRTDAAEAMFRRALHVDPAHPVALRHLAVVLANQDRLDESLPLFERAEQAFDPDHDPDPRVARAIALCRAARIEEGAVELLRVLPERPDLNGSLQLGSALLTLGDFERGWPQLEHRWFLPPLSSQRADYGVPHWSGQPLEGRTILVRAEQGIGDLFQSARFLPMLKARGARVIFQPPDGLDAIARRLRGVDRVARGGESLPAFDYFANAMSLPLAFGTTPGTVPRDVPYVTADPAYLAKWTPRLRERDPFTVGLIWAGRPEHLRDRQRSIELERLAPLLAVPGVRFVSLQQGPALAQAAGLSASVDWISLGPELRDLDDTLAVLSMLDLIIGVDTGPMHMAGALGKDAWMLLPSPPDYRWLLDREDSLWYPTMRLFRQATPRDWTPVVERVAQALQARVASRRDGLLREAPASERASLAPTVLPPAANLAIAAQTRAGFMQFVPDEPLIGPSLAHGGEWLQRELELALSFAGPGATVIEAGAGAGAHALPLARAVAPAGTLLAWESRPAFRRVLAHNLAAHGLARATIMARSLEGGGAHGFDARRESVDDLRLRRLDLLKLNDGARVLPILEGASDTLWRCRPAVMIIAADPAIPRAASDVLRGFGYRGWTAATRVFRPENFNRRTSDVQGGACVHAMLALPEEIDVRDPMPGGSAWP